MKPFHTISFSLVQLLLFSCIKVQTIQVCPESHEVCVMNVMKTNHSVVAVAHLKQLNEFARKLAHSSRRDKWVENCSNSPNKKFILFYIGSQVNNWLN